ncbi:LysM peptidoglycan-binding domain-containing protein [Parachitinimonas caeni]|uniref:LysM peptidoglycan-binding domain-containing protein n=1 Tax=Parachitinimonas caeni TaxID=3031301 RepID=A0ABT7E0U1_9NEIS|nr:LysM peptidoglycan-binding domain-containing protein [Parachitinimonas caeni]MDK2125911.1 LysM peptidoglycan-binding domain-containing protein [Parachitinimonas caeni]
MVAIVAGRDTGLFSGSAIAQIGAGQQSGVQGRSGESVAVNVTNGNLVLQRQDELLSGRGLDATLVRTYNSQAKFSDDNSDAWWLAGYRRLQNLQGNIGANGSTIERVTGDGSVQRFTCSGGVYRSTDGDGAHDTLSFGNGSWTWTDGSSQATETYSAFGSVYRLVASNDLSGNPLTYSYNGDLLSRISTANGEAIELTYNGRNLTSERVIKADGNVTRTYYAYDEQNRLKQVTVDLSPDDNTTTDGKIYQTVYRYDGNSNRLAGIEQTDGSRLSFTYVQVAGEYRLETVTDALSRVTRFSYNTTTRTTTVFDPYSNATLYTYDGEQRLLSVTAPTTSAGAQSVGFEYDAAGNLYRSTDAQGNVVTYSYDAAGNQTSQQDALGNRIERSYGSANQLLTETSFAVPDPDGVAGAATASQPMTTRFAYDSQLNLRFVVSAEGRVTEYRYNAQGQRTSQIAYLGGLYPLSGLGKDAALTEAQLLAWSNGQSKAQTSREDYGYSLRGLNDVTTRYTQVDSNGNGVAAGASITRQTYDTAGRLLTSVDANTNQTSYSYDGLGRLLSTTDANQKATLHSYDDAGRTITHTLANARVDTEVYDAAGQLISKLTGGQLPVQYRYDNAGRLAWSQDANGTRQYRLYDEANRLVGEVDAGTSQLTEHLYNQRGEKVRTIRYLNPLSYEGFVALTKPDGSPANPSLDKLRPAADAAHDLSVWYLYDKAGRQTKTVDAQGYVSETRYDGAGRIVAEIRYATPQATLPTATSKAEDIQPSATDSRVSRRFYDNDGKLVGTLDAAGYLNTIDYDKAGRAWHAVRYATAVNATLAASSTLAQLQPAANAAQDQHSYTFYDGQNRAIGTLDAERYLSEVRYDAAGNKLSETRYATPVASSLNLSASSTLDSLRPADSPLDHTQSFTYTKLLQVETTTATDGTVSRFTYDAMGQRTQTVIGSNAGNDARYSLTRYNALGQVIAELNGEGAALAIAAATPAAADTLWAKYGVSYQYDAIGRRTQAISRNPVDDKEVRTLFYYDGGDNLVYTVNAQGDVLINFYSRLGQLTDTRKLVKRVAADTLAKWQGGDFNTISAHIGTLTGTDDLAEHYEYNARGEKVLTLTSAGGRETFSYTAFGELKDSLSALGDNRNRHASFVYDARGLLKEATVDGTEAKTSRTEYDAFGRVVQTTSAGNVVQRQRYDRLGRVVTVQGAQNSSATFDAFGRVLTQTDAYGRTTTTVYDDKLRTITVTTPEGIKTVTEKNRFGETFKLTDGEGNVSEYAYDRNGRLITTKRPVSADEYQETTQSYDAAGRLTDTVLKTYRKAGNAFQVVDAKGVVTRFEYDAANRVLAKRTDPDGLNLATRYAFDGVGRTIQTTDPAGTVTVTEYDAGGRVKATVIDPKTTANPNGLNLRTEYTYDTQGAVLTVIEGAGSTQPKTTQYIYDVQGRREQEIVDPAGLKLTTTYRYDRDDRVISKTDGEGRITRFAYDNRGLLVMEVNHQGEVVESIYDNSNRLIEKRQWANRMSDAATLPAVLKNTDRRSLRNDALDKRQRFIYDKDGRNIFEIGPDGQITERIYDKRGLVVGERRYASAVLADVPAIRDANGNLTRLNGSDYANLLYSRLLNRQPDAPSFANYMESLRKHPELRGPGLAQDILNAGEFKTAWAGYSLPLDGAANNRNFVIWAYRTLLGRTQDPSVSEVDGWMGLLRTENTAKRGELVWAFLTSDEAIDNNIDNATQREWTFLRDYRNDATDSVLSRGYDALGREQTLTVNGITVATNRYDAAGNLFTVTNAASTASRFEYDAAGRKTRETDAKGQVTEFVYDAASRIKERRQWTLATQALAGGVLRREADGSYTFHGPEGEQINFTAQTSYLDIARRSPALARAWQASYGFRIGYAIVAQPQAARHASELAALWANSQPGQSMDWAQGKWVRNLDDSATYTDPQGQVFRLTQSMSVAEIASLSPAIAQQWQRDYGLQLASDQSVLNAGDTARMNADFQAYFSKPVHDAKEDLVTGYLYDAAGRLKTLTNPDGSSEKYEYDSIGRKTQLTNVRGSVTTYTFDGAGRLNTETSAAIPVMTAAEAQIGYPQLITRYVYDKAGNLTERWENDGAGVAEQKRVTKFFYNAAGRQYALEQPTFARANGTPALDNEGLYNLASLNLASLSTSKVPRSETAYDAFGNAVAHLDEAGNWSCKSYDGSGRVRFEVDPLGQVTEHRYDMFGNQKELIRYGGRISTPANATGYTTAELAAKVAGLDQNDKRVMRYEYDRNGQLVKTIEPKAYQFNQSGTAEAGKFERETRQVYNKLGQLVKQSVTLDATQTADTYFYYDALGRKVGQVDAGGYLSTWNYDERGNAFVDVQYSAALRAGSYNADSKLADLIEQVANRSDKGSSSARVHRQVYDRMNRAIADVQVNAHAGMGVRGDLTTFNRYDAAGNLIVLTDARGNSHYRYYDALGRLALELNATGDLNGELQYTAIGHSYNAFGNEVRTLRYGETLARSRLGASPEALSPNSVFDMFSKTLVHKVETRRFDAAGHQIEYRLDAEGIQGGSIRQSWLYDAQGRAVLEWTANQNADGAQNNTVRSFVFDAAGRQTATIERLGGVGTATRLVTTSVDYNSYGDITRRAINNETQSLYRYDEAGRIWARYEKGSWSASFYNRAGQETARLVSPVEGAIANAASAEALGLNVVADSSGRRIINASPVWRRSYTDYNALGQVTRQIDPTFNTSVGGLFYAPDTKTQLRPASGDIKTAPIMVPKTGGNISGPEGEVQKGTRITLLPRWLSVAGVTGLTGKLTIETSFTLNGVARTISKEADLNSTAVYPDDIEDPANAVQISEPVVRVYGTVNGSRQLLRDSTQAPIALLSLPRQTPDSAVSWVRVRQPDNSWKVFAPDTSLDGDFNRQEIDKLLGGSAGPREVEIIKMMPGIGLTADMDSIALAKHAVGYARFNLSRVNGQTQLALTGDGLITATTAERFMEQDRWGNRVSLTDSQRNTSRWLYNSFNQVTNEYGAITARVNERGQLRQAVLLNQARYDLFGQVQEQRDGEGHITVFDYDRVGHNTAQWHRITDQTTLSADDISALNSRNGATGQYSLDSARSYDGFGRLSEEQADTAVAKNVYRYNVADQLIQIRRTGDVSQLSKEADSTNVSTKTGTQITQVTELTDYRYDSRGQRVLEARYRENLATSQLQTRQDFDSQGHVIASQQLELQNGQISNRGTRHVSGYDVFGNKVSEKNLWWNAAGQENTADAKTWGYDATGLLKSHSDLSNNVYTYTYNAAGQQASQRMTLSGQNARNEETTGLQYRTGRIDRSFAYDEAGHLISTRESRTANVADWVNGQTVIRDQITNLGDATRRYDSEGRVVMEQQDRGNLYWVQATAYDNAGRLERVAANGVAMTYYYDGAGNRRAVLGASMETAGTRWVGYSNWYRYDDRNRVAISQGMLVGEGIVVARRSHFLLQRPETTVANNMPNFAGASIAIPPDQQAYDLNNSGTSLRYRGSGTLRSEVTTKEKRLTNTDINEYTVGDKLAYDDFGRVTAFRHNSNMAANASDSAYLNQSRRQYDYAGRVGVEETFKEDGAFDQRRFNNYDADGRLVRQQSVNQRQIYDNRNRWVNGEIPETGGSAPTKIQENVITSVNYTYTGETLKSYGVKDEKSGQTTTYDYAYAGFESWKEVSQTAKTQFSNGQNSVGETTTSLDDYGNALKIRDTQSPSGDRVMKYDIDGRLLEKRRGSDARAQRFAYAGGNIIGSTAGTDAGQGSDFDYNYTALSAKALPTTTQSNYVVNTGDTLQKIALATWGDANLWYLVADANGIKPTDTLKPGSTLKIPSTVTAANRSDTFKPYNAQKLIGDTTPNIPPPPPLPQKDQCGLAQVMMIAVAIVVTVYTAGAVASALGASVGGAVGTTAAIGSASIAAGTTAAVTAASVGTMATGAAVLGGTFGATGLVAAAVGGAVGSVASQALGVALGVQDSISWKGVATSALGAGLTAGIGSSGLGDAIKGLGYGKTATTALTAAASSAITQGVMSMADMGSFSWRNVAAAAIAAPITEAISDHIFGTVDTKTGRVTKNGAEWARGSNFMANVANNFAGGVVNRAAQILVHGEGKLNVASIAANAFGDALGNSIAGRSREALYESRDNRHILFNAAATKATNLKNRDGVEVYDPNTGLVQSYKLTTGSTQMPAHSTDQSDEAAFIWEPKESYPMDFLEDSVAGFGGRSKGPQNSSPKKPLTNDAPNFAFSDGRDARDIQAGFMYQARMKTMLSRIQQQRENEASLPQMMASPPPTEVNPWYKGWSSFLGLVNDSFGMAQGAAVTVAGTTLFLAPEPTTLSKWGGAAMVAYGAPFATKSAGGFLLNCHNLLTALSGSKLETDYLPGSVLEVVAQRYWGTPESQRVAVAADLAWGLPMGRAFTATQVPIRATLNPRVAALFQPRYIYTTAEQQLITQTSGAWSTISKIEKPAVTMDVLNKKYENILLPVYDQMKKSQNESQ